MTAALEFTPEVTAAMRRYLERVDAFLYMGRADFAALDADSVPRAVERHYPDGLAGFLLDHAEAQR